MADRRKESIWAFLVATALLLSLLKAEPLLAAALEPESPRLYVDTAMPDSSRYAVIELKAGDDLQQAIDQASCGTVIRLQADATFTGNFILKNKGECEGKWIILTSSRQSELPAEASRISPVHSALMPKIVSPNTMSALGTEPYANHFRIIGIEITSSHTPTSTLYQLLSLGYGETEIDQLPSHIIIDRCYIHGRSDANVRRGIMLNSRTTAIIDSYISDIHEAGADSQAIGGWGGCGPFKIVNNYLEGAGENVMFGGAAGLIPDLVPSDIEFKNNHVTKPWAWRIGDPAYAGVSWSIKNLLELKNAQRVLIEGNIFENNWANAQGGQAILFTPRSGDSGLSAVVMDVTFQKNIVRSAASAIGVLGRDDDPRIGPDTIQAKRFLIKDNIFEDITGVKYGAGYGGSLFTVFVGPWDYVIDHNTAFQNGCFVQFTIETYKDVRFTYTNNLQPFGGCGVGGELGGGTVALNYYADDWRFEKNVIHSMPNEYPYSPSLYPPENFFPLSIEDVGLANYNNGMDGDYALVPSSPYKNAGTDGKDIGADIGAVRFATRGALTGIWEPDAILPSKPAGLRATAVSSSQINLAWAPSTDNIAVAGYRIYRNGSEAATSTGASFEDNSLRPKTVYRYQVLAYDEAGNLSNKSKAVSKMTQPLPSTKFSIGDPVRVTMKVVVRSTPLNAGASTGTQAKGAAGRVIGGPSFANGTWWWQIDFDNDPDGWVLGNKLRK